MIYIFIGGVMVFCVLLGLFWWLIDYVLVSRRRIEDLEENLGIDKKLVFFGGSYNYSRIDLLEDYLKVQLSSESRTYKKLTKKK